MKKKHFNEKGEEPQSLYIDLAKKDFARSKTKKPDKAVLSCNSFHFKRPLDPEKSKLLAVLFPQESFISWQSATRTSTAF